MDKKKIMYIVGGIILLVVLYFVLKKIGLFKSKTDKSDYFKPIRPSISTAPVSVLPEIDKKMDTDLAGNRLTAESGLGIWGMNYGYLRSLRQCKGGMDCDCYNQGDFIPCSKPYNVIG